MNAYTVEKVYEIWGCDGERMEVGQDREGLGLIEIRDWEDMDKVQTTMLMCKEQAKLVIECLRELVLDLEKKELVLDLEKKELVLDLEKKELVLDLEKKELL